MAVLDVRDVTKRYRNGTLANDGISLAVEAGQVYGLLGPNGAGKTTLVRQVLGLLKPTSGAICVDGVDVIGDPGYARRAIGALPQSQVNMQGLRLHEWVYGVARLRGLTEAEATVRTDTVINRLELEPFRDTTMAAASGGVRRLAGFCAAVVARPGILLLDEPTNDVDPARRQLLWQYIAELGRDGTSILLVTHNLAEAERVLDRLAIIDHGRILREGTPAALRQLVTDRMKLHAPGLEGSALHPALLPDPAEASCYLLERSALPPVVAWLEDARAAGRVADYHIGPPSLDDVYAAVVKGDARELECVA